MALKAIIDSFRFDLVYRDGDLAVHGDEFLAVPTAGSEDFAPFIERAIVPHHLATGEIYVETVWRRKRDAFEYAIAHRRALLAPADLGGLPPYEWSHPKEWAHDVRLITCGRVRGLANREVIDWWAAFWAWRAMAVKGGGTPVKEVEERFARRLIGQAVAFRPAKGADIFEFTADYRLIDAGGAYHVVMTNAPFGALVEAGLPREVARYREDYGFDPEPPVYKP